ncbi:MAG: hypothetical protein ABIR70_23385 [Bryobacteraceae bacterium]
MYLIPNKSLARFILIMLGTACLPTWGQLPDPTVLVIDTENVVEYVDDVGVPAKFGLTPTIVPLIPPSGFPYIAAVGDIVAVNGQPAKGSLFGSIMAFGASPTILAGRSIADATRSSMRSFVFEILKTDGSQVGSITTLGMNGGTAPPGAPSTQSVAAYTIVGGTGAFLGARGQGGQIRLTVPAARQASMAEDPANRRINGGGTVRFVLQVLPAYSPSVVSTSAGPAVTHSKDFTLVTPDHPAAPGETLSIFVSGLGPTRPSRDSGAVFPANPPSTVTSPVAVTIGGKTCSVTAAVGYPGTLDGFQVNIVLPADVPAGLQELQVSSAWVTGPAVKIVVK